MDTDPACGTSGLGSIHVTVTGLPAGVVGQVTLTGPTTITTGGSNDFLEAAGSYEVSAAIVASADPIVRTAYAPAVTTKTVCARSGSAQTVEVSYREIGSSNKLWATNENGPSGELLGFSSVALGATGSPGASVAATAPAGGSLGFDQEGNLWAIGSSAGIVRFAAADLGASGPSSPDRTIGVDVGGCAPGLTAMAFDQEGSLWITSSCANEIVKLTSPQLAADATPAPSVIVSSATDPQGIAFDAMGNLWVTDSTAGTIARYDAERLTASTAEPADLAITPRATATPGAAQRVPTYLAFDATGDLWAIDFAGNAVYELTPSQLAGAGAGDAVPAVQIAIDVLADLESMAFDEGGGLWLTFAQGQVARLAAAQLHQSTDAGSPTVPQTVIRSPDLGSAAGLAFYPSPAALPLYSSVR